MTHKHLDSLDHNVCRHKNTWTAPTLTKKDLDEFFINKLKPIQTWKKL